MKTKTLLVASLIGVVQLLTAQTVDKKFAVGLNVGKTEYNGDYGSSIFDFNKRLYSTFGLSLATYLSPSFDLGLEGNTGDYGYIEDIATQKLFNGRKMEMSLYTQYKLNNGYIMNAESRLSPFISVGIGFATYGLSPNDTHTPHTIIRGGTDLVVPVGAGLKFQFTKSLALQYKYLYSFTNRDIHDENMGPDYFGSPAHPYSKPGNDAYGQHFLSVIFTFGKQRDADEDGIADRFDKCVETPLNVVVDKAGCPVDTDLDGVADYLDKCENTPTGVQVDAAGCPFDTDGDGVADYLDKCPGTPEAVKVDANGCPYDTDGDGVLDYLDKCIDTPATVKVDAKGCPVDSDGDGVADYLDTCPDTPLAANAKVDKNGCLLDTDGDGILDYLDNCPNIAGEASNKGCPEVKKEVKTLFQKALQGIQFETAKADIKAASYPLLNQIANILILNPTYLIEVQGHTDNVGNDEYNFNLSRDRAASVRAYLVEHGVPSDKITSNGFGETTPVADNNTKAGKAKNRRVEFVVSFEK